MPNCNYVRVELYQESTETINSKKKSKKEKENVKDANTKPSSFIHAHLPSHTLLGIFYYIEIIIL